MSATTSTQTSICIDMGTTNTRVWLVRGDAVVDRMTEPIGLRDAARDPHQPVVRDTLAKLITAAHSRAAALGLEAHHVLAAGMLTSPLGLCEVPHIPAPAGEVELARALHQFSDPRLTDLPVYLVPGVRSGPNSPTLDDLAATDLIRGEETLVVGLVHAGILLPGSTFLSLGSHWKAIAVGQDSRIISSFTTLSGELLHAVQTQTVLASALPQGRFDVVDSQWLARGRDFQNSHGTGRTLFSVRLLEQIYRLAPAELSSFLLGATVASDFESMDRANALRGPILIAGSGASPQAWQHILQAAGRTSQILPAASAEEHFVCGLVRLFELHRSQAS